MAPLRVLTRAKEPQRREDHNRNNRNVIRVLSRDGVFCQNQTRTVVVVVVVEVVFKNLKRKKNTKKIPTRARKVPPLPLPLLVGFFLLGARTKTQPRQVFAQRKHRTLFLARTRADPLAALTEDACTRAVRAAACETWCSGLRCSRYLNRRLRGSLLPNTPSPRPSQSPSASPWYCRFF